MSITNTQFKMENEDKIQYLEHEVQNLKDIIQRLQESRQSSANINISQEENPEIKYAEEWIKQHGSTHC